jgi:hypothetical protein
MGNIRVLAIGCQFFQSVCPVIDLASLPVNLTVLALTNAKVVAGNKEVSFPGMDLLVLERCRVQKDVRSKLHRIFANLEQLLVPIEDAVEPGFLDNVLNSKIQALTISVVLGTSYSTRFKFEQIVKNLMKITLPSRNYTRGSGITFRRHENYWDYKIAAYPLDQLTRINKLLRLLDISTVNISQKTLDSMYYTYSIFVYTVCSIGFVCNCLSAVVLMQKSMKSSTSYIMFSLALYDSIYLFTSMFTVEEFQLLFSYEFVRSVFNGYVAYPLNQTGKLYKYSKSTDVA